MYPGLACLTGLLSECKIESYTVNDAAGCRSCRPSIQEKHLLHRDSFKCLGRQFFQCAVAPAGRLQHGRETAEQANCQLTTHRDVENSYSRVVRGHAERHTVRLPLQARHLRSRRERASKRRVRLHLGLQKRQVVLPLPRKYTSGFDHSCCHFHSFV